MGDPPKEIFRVSLTLVFVKVTSSSDYEELDDGDSTLARLDPSFPPVPSIHSSSSKQHRAFANIAVATDADMPNPAVNSFGTFLIIGPTCFFLGMLFSSLPYDYHVLWHEPADRAPYFDLLENHLRFLHASPPLISRILHVAIGVGFIGFMSKLYKPSEANMLFDGASLVLYMVGITVYIANIVKGLRVVTDGTYDQSEAAQAAAAAYEKDPSGSVAVIGREDSLRVLAASNTILALVLIGILVLQAGQWYAQKKEEQEVAEMNKKAAEKKVGAKKKQ